jgi:histidine kinase-like protein
VTADDHARGAAEPAPGMEWDSSPFVPPYRPRPAAHGTPDTDPPGDWASARALPRLVPGAELRWRRVVPGQERQLGRLREWLAGLLPPGPARDDVTCVMTELATNAIRHTASGRGGWFGVEVIWYGPTVRVAVADNGGPTEPALIEDPLAEHGRGLLLVRGLSLRTGVVGDHRGRLIWADIAWNSPRTARPGTLGDPFEASIHEDEAALAARCTGIPAWFGRTTLQW